MTLCVFFLIGILNGCGPWTTALRRNGFNQIQRGFEVIPATPELHRIVVLRNVRIHIVGDRKHFSASEAAAFGSPILGYATHQNEIWVLGKVVDGRIVVNQAILGHELNHLLNFSNANLFDPDSLDDLGL